ISLNASSATTGTRPSLRFYKQSGNPSAPASEAAAEAYPWYIDGDGTLGVGRLLFLSGTRATIGAESVSPKVAFLSTGHVGLGTTDPEDHLHIKEIAGEAGIYPVVRVSHTSATNEHYGQLGMVTPKMLLTDPNYLCHAEARPGD